MTNKKDPVARCDACQMSDGMYCIPCDLAWDMNDPDPPRCKPKDTTVVTLKTGSKIYFSKDEKVFEKLRGND